MSKHLAPPTPWFYREATTADGKPVVRLVTLAGAIALDLEKENIDLAEQRMRALVVLGFARLAEDPDLRKYLRDFFNGHGAEVMEDEDDAAHPAFNRIMEMLKEPT